jgi:hypothetical protein
VTQTFLSPGQTIVGATRLESCCADVNAGKNSYPKTDRFPNEFCVANAGLSKANCAWPLIAVKMNKTKRAENIFSWCKINLAPAKMMLTVLLNTALGTAIFPSQQFIFASKAFRLLKFQR